MGYEEELVFPRDARDKHLFDCGGTGAGKSKFLEFLIRQDIAAWRKSHCGLLFLDYHGAVYDSLMQWMAYRHLNRPVIPIDLRRDDWIVAYNVLRKRTSASTDVIVENFIQSMVYVCGLRSCPQSGASPSPRCLGVDQVQELDPFLMRVPRQATGDHLPLRHLQCGE